MQQVVLGDVWSREAAANVQESRHAALQAGFKIPLVSYKSLWTSALGKRASSRASLGGHECFAWTKRWHFTSAKSARKAGIFTSPDMHRRQHHRHQHRHHRRHAHLTRMQRVHRIKVCGAGRGGICKGLLYVSVQHSRSAACTQAAHVSSFTGMPPAADGHTRRQRHVTLWGCACVQRANCSA